MKSACQRLRGGHILQRPGRVCSCVFRVKVLSPAEIHTLLIAVASRMSLRCRAMHQTPIYDQLRSERTNADVSPNDIDSGRLVHCGRHSLGTDVPNAAAVVRPVRHRTDDVTGHHRRVQVSPTGARSGDELSTAEGDDSAVADAAEAGVRSAPRHAAVVARRRAVAGSPDETRSQP
jgi:hypothetical protein